MFIISFFSIIKKRMKLVIGNKNYSSWSLRPWLLLSEFNIDFDEVQELLGQENLRDKLARYSPTCKVPVLIDDVMTIWDSLAICEYISERYLKGAGWPGRGPGQSALRCTQGFSGSEMTCL